MDNRSVFLGTADAVVDLVARIPSQDWDLPALGVWDVRSLVGHTSRAMTTVLDYLGDRRETVDVPTAAHYFAGAKGMDAAVHQAVAGRGVADGRALGDDPAKAFAEIRRQVGEALDAVDGDPVVATRFGAMVVSEYLVTRIFELVIHGSDIAAATGLPVVFPDQAVRATLDVTVDALTLTGDALAAARYLAGRDGSAFSVF